jgi:5-(carboxyamino)imidazole ribonucleotide synthase
MAEALPPGAVIGILGGGQLGRMLSVAAARLGYRCHIFDPTDAPPAGQVAETVTTAAWDDAPALEAFARSVDVVTYEFENVPAAALDVIEALVPVRPGRVALETSQDRMTEKTFLANLGLGTAPFCPVDDVLGLTEAYAQIGLPAFLKTRRFGYDGKGQVRLTSSDQINAAIASVAGAPCILEGAVEFSAEISVIAARDLSGTVAAFDPGLNVHVDGILRNTNVPAPLSPEQAADARRIAGAILQALDYVGVIGVELFVTPEGLLVNEFAPRVHNSGHWTQNACVVDQFEAHIRAITGMELGDLVRFADVEMTNLIGGDVDDVPRLAASPGVALHLYGKAEARPGRKMGHVNRVIRRA